MSGTPLSCMPASSTIQRLVRNHGEAFPRHYAFGVHRHGLARNQHATVLHEWVYPEPARVSLCMTAVSSNRGEDNILRRTCDVAKVAYVGQDMF
jgi:hypothetical protein